MSFLNGPYAVSASLLRDIAFSTSIEASLASVCHTRPNVLRALTLQVTYFVSIAAMMKASLYDDVSTNTKGAPPAASTAVVTDPHRSARVSKVITATPLQLRVVLIGCGSVGSLIATHLLQVGVLHPTSLSIVTRQPELLGHFASKGVRCFPQDEVAVVSEADVVVIACQPGQLEMVSKRLHGKLPQGCIVISVLCGVSAEKLRSEFGNALCLVASVDVAALAFVTSKAVEAAQAESRERRLKSIQETDSAAFLRQSSTQQQQQQQYLEQQQVPVHSVDADVARLSFPSDENGNVFCDEAVDFVGNVVWTMTLALIAKRRGDGVSPASQLLTLWSILLPQGSIRSEVIARLKRVLREGKAMDDVFLTQLDEHIRHSYKVSVLGLTAKGDTMAAPWWSPATLLDAVHAQQGLDELIVEMASQYQCLVANQ